MVLLADGGSTKCDWVLLDEIGSVVFKSRTQGLNPNMLTTQKMHKRLAQSEEIAHVNQDIKHVYFYGAGCGSEKARIRLKRFLEKYFRHAECEVYEDLMAACLSVTDRPGIVCILGTGSNSCYFDGINAEVAAPSLGYSVMDEASGNYFGKQLLRDYFYKKMPAEIAEKFKAEYDLFPHTIKENLYRNENASSYLAAFARFMFSFDPLPEYFRTLIAKGIEDFTENWILTLPQAKECPIHFVGSIAHFSKEIIAEVLESKGLSIGNVTRHPVDGLTAYFQNRINTPTV